MDNILNKLESIENRLKNIENILEEQEVYSKKMSNHIDFVDNIYDGIKKPFYNVLSFYSGGKAIAIDKKQLENVK